MSNARNLARVLADTSGAIAATNLANAVPADGSITNAKLASGAVTASKVSGALAKANMASGSVLQVVSYTKTDTFSTNSTSWVDITGFNLSITPTSATSKILVLTDVSIGAPSGGNGVVRLLRDGNLINAGDAAGSRPRTFSGHDSNPYGLYRVAGSYVDSPATTSAINYKLQMQVSTGTAGIGRTSNDRDSALYDPRAPSGSITLLEIAV